jgi:transcriptional regulator with XRE-family HTH domain
MRLKELRESKGLTQKEVAEIIGYSEIYYGRNENRKREPDISTLCKLAEYYNVTVDYLIGRV